MGRFQPPEREIAFRTSRVLLQDFTGVPAIVDLAAMRDAIAALGGDPTRINPLQPVDLVIDHSVQVDEYGRMPRSSSMRASSSSVITSATDSYGGAKLRSEFPRRARPTRASCTKSISSIWRRWCSPLAKATRLVAYPDSLVGTDSHTTMVNGLGVFGWGVGGIEAEAAMLGQPLSMLVPEVVGFRLHGQLPPGATATDLVLTVTQMLRKKKVVGKFVEFYGPGLSSLSLADRATIANMAPEYGATMGFFPVDSETLTYLRLTGRSERQVRLVESYTKAQGLFRTDATPDPMFADTLALDLGLGRAEPRRAETATRSRATQSGEGDVSGFAPDELEAMSVRAGGSAPAAVAAAALQDHGAVAHAPHGRGWRRRRPAAASRRATWCASSMESASRSATAQSSLRPSRAAPIHPIPRSCWRQACWRGTPCARDLKTKPWVKTSLAPGSKVVTEYYRKAGLMGDLETLGFNVVGYGCTTCIGNSGPLPEPIADAVERNKLVVAAVLSGNRNFEGRINPLTRFNYLASPPLVVAYALAGRMDIDLATEPLGVGSKGPVFLRDIWPAPREVEEEILRSVKKEMFRDQYANVFAGDDRWQGLNVPTGDRYAWAADSTYVKNPPYFDGMTLTPPGVVPITGARALAMLGDSITTDHISPAGSIPAKSPAGEWLLAHGVTREDFNSYGARRGNHEVMVRGHLRQHPASQRNGPGHGRGVDANRSRCQAGHHLRCVPVLRRRRYASRDHRG